MDDLLFSEVQIIHSDYIGKYTSEKRKELLKYGPKKRKKKKEKYWTQRTEKDWIKSRKHRYAEISIGHCRLAKNKALTFIQTKV